MFSWKTPEVAYFLLLNSATRSHSPLFSLSLSHTHTHTYSLGQKLSLFLYLYCTISISLIPTFIQKLFKRERERATGLPRYRITPQLNKNQVIVYFVNKTNLPLCKTIFNVVRAISLASSFFECLYLINTFNAFLYCT